MIDPIFWKGKKVFITGHTGFKGSWLCMWLNKLGAEVIGYALGPPTEPSLFKLCKIEELTHTIYGDIRNYGKLYQSMLDTNPDIVIHMAAQPLVLESYQRPMITYETNVMGTVHLLEAVRNVAKEKKNIKAVLNITTDKCYENKEWEWGYREIDSIGGHDPYSNSKACSELITSSYRDSFFHHGKYSTHGIALATARAGNVIGGGDFSSDRLVPDCMKALLKDEKIIVRNPLAVRPWQHVLEPLSGYLILSQMLYLRGVDFAESWNFGPREEDAKEVQWLVDTICQKWIDSTPVEYDSSQIEHEARYLKLDWSKAKWKLGWEPKWRIDQAIDKVLDWTIAYKEQQPLREVCFRQIEEYMQK